MRPQPAQSRADPSTAVDLELREVSKRYARSGEAAIESLSLRVPAGEICVLVGPSGSGKTTALRLINRMIALTSGDILLDGRSVLDRRPTALRKQIGYVIQQIGLFPHMSIEENLAAVPQLLGWKRPRIDQRVDELFTLIGMDRGEFGKRYPSALSGGQRQRIGVARALAADPPLLLMDEPFGAIDPINRNRLQEELLRLQAQVRKTIVFVTHDIDEAIRIGDRIAILRTGGTLAQYATPDEILSRPADAFVADFVGRDRALKRLGLIGIADVPLAPLAEAPPNAETVRSSATARDALALLVQAGRPVVVVNGSGLPEGVLTLAALLAVAAPTAPRQVPAPVEA